MKNCLYFRGEDYSSQCGTVFLNERKIIQINFICELKFSEKSNITPALVFEDEKKEAITWLTLECAQQLAIIMASVLLEFKTKPLLENQSLICKKKQPV